MTTEISTKPRKRTKRLLNLIQSQLDFYFSDANLRHDRFLRKEIQDSQGGYIDLELMLKFNKLKNLSEDISMLAKAVDNSSKLKLSEDRTKLCRVDTLLELKNTDSQTVYVEQLPGYVDHDWLKQVFSTCGTVDYISLPRYKHNNRIKGFGFIEYSTPLEAAKACQLLHTAVQQKNKNKKRHSSEPNASDNQDDESKTKINKRKRSRSYSESDSEIKHPTPQTESNNIEEPCVKRKRRKSLSESSNGDNKQYKKYKLEDKEKIKTEKCDTVTNVSSKEQLDVKDKQLVENVSDVKEICNVKVKQENQEQDISKTNVKDDVNVEKKSTRKHLRKHKRNKDEVVKELSVPPLYVISKNEWSTLKKQYKNLQRKEIGELKKNIRILRSEKVRQSELKERIQETLKAKQTNKNVNKVNENCKGTNEEDQLVNKQNSRKRMHQENAENNPSKHCADKPKEHKVDEPIIKKVKTGLEMQMGTVCRIDTSTENLTKVGIKSQLSDTGEVAYIDFKDGGDKGFIRFKSDEERKKAIESKSKFDFDICELNAEEEKSYFMKAEEDRRKKYELNERKKKKKERGQAKVMKQVEALS